MSRFKLQTPTVTIKLRDMKVFSLSMLFAYACKGKEMTLEVMTKVNGPVSEQEPQTSWLIGRLQV